MITFRDAYTGDPLGRSVGGGSDTKSLICLPGKGIFAKLQNHGTTSMNVTAIIAYTGLEQGNPAGLLLPAVQHPPAVISLQILDDWDGKVIKFLGAPQEIKELWEFE